MNAEKIITAIAKRHYGQYVIVHNVRWVGNMWEVPVGVMSREEAVGTLYLSEYGTVQPQSTSQQVIDAAL